ncbi:uncharacterized protein EV420DRAFT_1074475 [Desarmillaria tabescens]|uniref:F-box domain-containing protein n=1 Tax=Armillaria tabescens TaxID=1929756 RepID=A0AA39JIS8_ARMTA|nr:uncharacterized protein EV420DRAFT_1074475 [Desarmillaria tabescens]KAK0442710.1 hypothetical protein EV420DRAFT_1074475 [Desarmillaria tabescens]
MKSTFKDDDVYSWPSTIICHKCSRSLPSSKDPTLSSSELFQRLHEGYSPAESELKSISGVHSQIVKEVVAYDVEILRLLQTLENLHRDRDRLRTYADHYGTLISPVRRLPYDVLLQIFREVCRKQYNIHAPQMSLRLGLVCKHWRAITLDSPSLWSTITIPLNFFPWSRWSARDKIVQIQLLRSEQIPLTLEFLTLDVDDHDHAFNSIVQSLHGQRHRIRQVECSLSALPLLQSDMLEAAEDMVIMGHSCTEPLNHYTLHVPNLRSLTIGDHVPLRRVDIPQHLHTLNLVLRRKDFISVLDSLPGMCKLRYLTIEARGTWHSNRNVNPICLNTVTSLTLRSLHPSNDNTSYFLRSIHVPALSHFTIVGGSLQLDAIKSLLERSSPPLKSLEIMTNVNTVPVDLPKFMAILQAVPGLTTLAIHEQRSNVAVTASLLRELVFDGDHEPLLPKLEHLELVSGTPWTDVEKTIMHLIQSRHGGCTSYRGRRTDAPLKSVMLNWQVLCTKPVFQEMRRTGLQIWEILPMQRIIR